MAGAPSALVIGGESGVGKTRLVAEFLDRAAREAGATTLVGGCIDLGSGALPYWPVVDALRSLVRRQGRESLEEAVGPLRSELSRLLPELGSDGGAAGTHNWGLNARVTYVFPGTKHTDKTLALHWYDGNQRPGDAVKALLGNTVQLNSGALAPALPQIQAGSLKALAQTGT